MKRHKELAFHLVKIESLLPPEKWPTFEDVFQTYLDESLKRTQGNVLEACRLMKIGPSTFYRAMRRRSK